MTLDSHIQPNHNGCKVDRFSKLNLDENIMKTVKIPNQQHRKHAFNKIAPGKWAVIMLLSGVIALFYHLKHGYGSTKTEQDESIAGDNLIPKPHSRTTHAITIQAPPSAIWPWLVQMGYGRAGWYIDARWDRWINENIWVRIVPPEERANHWQSADHILSQWQDLVEGDLVPDGPPETAYFTVAKLKPEQWLVLLSDTHVKYMTPRSIHSTRLATQGKFTWAFVLERLDKNRTRLILRMSGTMAPILIRLISKPLIIGADYIYTRNMLRSIKRRVEIQQETRISSLLQEIIETD